MTDTLATRATPEHAEQVIDRLTPEDKARLLDWLCGRDPALVLRTLADMRGYGKRRAVTS